MSQPIRWGILGYARIARTLVIPAILASGNSVLHALASRDAEKLGEARPMPSPNRAMPSISIGNAEASDRQTNPAAIEGNP